MSSNSTRKRRRRESGKPDKPYPEFPLYAHSLGYWSAKINKKIIHFGRWARTVSGKLKHLPYEASWRNALAAYKARIDDAKAGRIRETVVSENPAQQSDQLTVADLCNRFLTSKLRKLQAGELSPRSFAEYRNATDLLVGAFGKSRCVEHLIADDFESLRADMANRWGPARLGKFIQIIRSAFKYAADNRLVERPVLFGSAFTKPGKATMRKHKAASDKKLFAAIEVRSILDALAGKEFSVVKKNGKVAKVKLKANPPLRAAVLLGINAGLGNSDISGLRSSHLDLGSAWLDFPRVKTGLPRRVPLWNETIAALKAAIKVRRRPKDAGDTDLVFLNRAGGRMVVMSERSHQDYVSSQFRGVLRELNINSRRGLGFYSLRHTFATIALQAGDRDAVRYLMGHAAHDMLSAYDETGPSDERLKRVTDYVRRWLFGDAVSK
jgi:integrase